MCRSLSCELKQVDKSRNRMLNEWRFWCRGKQDSVFLRGKGNEMIVLKLEARLNHFDIVWVPTIVLRASPEADSNLIYTSSLCLDKRTLAWKNACSGLTDEIYHIPSHFLIGLFLPSKSTYSPLPPPPPSLPSSLPSPSPSSPGTEPATATAPSSLISMP